MRHSSVEAVRSFLFLWSGKPVKGLSSSTLCLVKPKRSLKVQLKGKTLLDPCCRGRVSSPEGAFGTFPWQRRLVELFSPSKAQSRSASHLASSKELNQSLETASPPVFPGPHDSHGTGSKPFDGIHPFPANENSYVEDYLRSHPVYSSTFYYPSSTTSLSQPVLNFATIAKDVRHCEQTITSALNRPVIEAVLTDLKSISDEELLGVIHHVKSFHPCPSREDPPYLDIWRRLDQECVRRTSKWDMDELFKCADVWNGLKLARFATFHRKLMSLCLTKCDTLSKEHFIRTLYCLNLARNTPKSALAFEIRNYLKDHVEEFNHHEVAIVAMACFKTLTAIKDFDVLGQMVQKFIVAKEDVGSVAVAAVAKFLRFSSIDKSRHLLYDFQKAYVSEVDRLSLQGCTHLALIGTKTLYPCMPLVDAVLKKLKGDIHSVRLKELERICLAIATFDTDCDNLLANEVVQELRSPGRANELNEYGRCLPAILHYLSMKEVYPVDLIDVVLNKDFRNTHYGEGVPDELLREMACLDFCAELELKGYTGSRLDKSTLDHILQCHVARVNRGVSSDFTKVSMYESNLKMIFTDVESLVDDEECYGIFNILPQHHCKKVVFCTGRQGEFVKIPAWYRTTQEHQIKWIHPRNKKEPTFHVLYLCNRGDSIRKYDNMTLSGQGKMVVRQLRKMGYTVHLIYPPIANKNLVQRIFHSLGKPKDRPRNSITRDT